MQRSCKRGVSTGVYRYHPRLATAGAKYIRTFFRTHGYSERWYSELREVLDALLQHRPLLGLIQEHSNPLRYFKDVSKVPALVVQEAEFRTILTTSKAGQRGSLLLQPAQQTICALSSSVTIHAKGQSHGRSHGYHPLPLR